MNQWYFIIGIMCLLMVLVLGILFCLILLVIKKIRKRNSKKVFISMGINIFMLVAVVLYAIPHSTYYKYNDWAILESNIYEVEQKYGPFDLGEIQDNKKGTVAYYIYTDNGPIMPDHLKHYYYIEYDVWGIVYKVYDACQPGG